MNFGADESLTNQPQSCTQEATTAGQQSPSTTTTYCAPMLICRQQPISHIPSYHTLFAPADEEQANDLNKLLESTSGHFEKLNDGNPLKLGPWQILWWQPRWYHAEHDGFCHQPISTTEATLASGYFSLARPRSKPIGKVTKIPYCSIDRIDIREAAAGTRSEEFTIFCGDRSYTFKCPNEDACARLVENLRELRALALR